MKRLKANNSSLHNVSKKRLAAIESGEYKPKPKKPLNKMSVKQRKKIKAYRELGFETRGQCCFLCGREEPWTILEIHHRDCNRNNNSPDNLFPLCNRFCGCKAHNHMGVEGLKELDEKIERKIRERNNGKEIPME